MLINNYNNKIKKMIRNADEVYIMGHKHIDLDSLGASLGMYYYITKSGKDCYIVIDDEALELSSKKIIDKVKYMGEDISSSRIREAIKNGNMTDAENMLRG